MKLHRRCRRGYSLLEMMAILAVGGMVMTMAGMLAVSLLKVRDVRRSEHDVNRAMLTLQQQWRTDVRGVLQGAVDQGGAVVLLTSPAGAVIEYRQEGPALHRIVRDDDRLVGRDLYPLPPGAMVRCLWPASAGEIATLAIEYPASANATRTVRTRPMQGVLGADLRFQRRDEPPTKGGS